MRYGLSEFMGEGYLIDCELMFRDLPFLLHETRCKFCEMRAGKPLPTGKEEDKLENKLPCQGQMDPTPS